MTILTDVSLLRIDVRLRVRGQWVTLSFAEIKVSNFSPRTKSET